MFHEGRTNAITDILLDRVKERMPKMRIFQTTLHTSTENQETPLAAVTKTPTDPEKAMSALVTLVRDKVWTLARRYRQTRMNGRWGKLKFGKAFREWFEVSKNGHFTKKIQIHFLG